MTYRREFSLKKNLSLEKLNSSEIFSIYYHNIFEFPLTFNELIRWVSKDPPKIKCNVKFKNGYYYVDGEEGLIYKRVLRQRISKQKYNIANKATKILSRIPSIKMVGITGSLAMQNSKEESDIDFIIITKRGHLWSTRILVYIILKIAGFKLRKPGNPKQKDKFCLNIWMDESDLRWRVGDRNFYTAHEILQIIPLVNKNNSYERFLWENRWVLKFWPNALNIMLPRNNTKYTKPRILNLIETLLFKIQYLYMKRRISGEKITKTRAIFHPVNLSIKINELLQT